MHRIRLVFTIGFFFSLTIVIIITVTTFRSGNDIFSVAQQYDSTHFQKLPIMQSNILMSSIFPKLARLKNCSLHPELFKMSMNSLLQRLDEIYNSPCILQPPLLVPTLDFYLGSYSISLLRKRLHLTFINCYPGRKCNGIISQCATSTSISH